MQDEPSSNVVAAGHASKADRSSGRVLVQVDLNRPHQTVVPHAVAIAHALDRQVSLIALINEEVSSNRPADPVQWDIRRQEALLCLDRIKQTYADTGLSIDVRVLEQLSPEDLGLADAKVQPILAFSRGSSVQPWLTNTAGNPLARRLCPSLLMAPLNLPSVRQVRYSRIVVPLDGSSLAETALPAALSLAQHDGAELLLVHVTADPEFMVRGPLDAEALKLQGQVRGRNARIAKSYLSDLRVRLQGIDVNASTRLLTAGDARRQLVSMATNEATDLIVMASHGSGNWSDVPTGSVASFVLEHAVQPVLMVSRHTSPMNKHLWLGSTSSDIRRADDSIISP